MYKHSRISMVLVIFCGIINPYKSLSPLSVAGTDEDEINCQHSYLQLKSSFTTIQWTLQNFR